MTHGTTLCNSKTLQLMGIVNLTCDSFSGGGFTSSESAVAHAEQLLADGADILDIGAESTRPGAEEVPADEEIRRLTPVVTALLKMYPDIVISIDTRHSRTAETMLSLGAKIINDVSALRFDPEMITVLKKYPESLLVLCHSRGEPGNMNSEEFCVYGGSVAQKVCSELLEMAERSGIPRQRIIFDPGFGFAKTPAQQMEMMRDANVFVQRLGTVLFGISRKSFLGKATGENDPRRRGGSTLAGELHLAECGGSFLRTHDVKQLYDALKFRQALSEVSK